MSSQSEAVPQERKPGRWLTRLVRWLHIYISMLGFLALLFFAVTGITLNHPDWFCAEEQAREMQGTIDFGGEVDKDVIVKTLRDRHAVGGAVKEFTADEYQCIVTFKGPGYSADAFIDRGTGNYSLTESRLGSVAILNDLHKGRDSGIAWSWIVDISAVIMTISSITGLVLLLSVKRRRRAGLVAAALGSALTILIYILYVP